MNVLPFLKRLYLADKAPINAAVVGGLVILASRAGFHLNASDTGYLAAGVGIVLGLLVQGKQAAKASSAAEHASLVAQYKNVLDKHEAVLDAKSASPAVSPAVVEAVQDTFPHPSS